MGGWGCQHLIYKPNQFGGWLTLSVIILAKGNKHIILGNVSILSSPAFLDNVGISSLPTSAIYCRQYQHLHERVVRKNLNVGFKTGVVFGGKLLSINHVKRKEK